MTEKQQPVPADQLEIVTDHALIMRLADAFQIQNDQLNEKDRTITELENKIEQLHQAVLNLQDDIEHHECGPDGR